MLGNRTDFDYTEGTLCPFFTSPSAFFAKRRRGDDKRREDVEKFWRSLRSHLTIFLRLTLTILSIYC